MKITCAAFVILIQALQCLASDDSPFQLTNKATGFCLVKTNNDCSDIRWTTGDRLLVPQRKKCLGVQGKSVGSEISLYDCDENSELQKWECKNETVLALKDQDFYIELTADNTAVLSKTVGPNNHLTISGTSNGACTRTFRELYAIGGNAAGRPCMFPFQYKDQWYSDCTLLDSSEKRLWCAVETKYQSERWGYCPVTSKEGWDIHPTTGAYYQLNAQSALTWSQAETSCKQQGASLLSITDPHEQAYIVALLGTGGNKLWTGLILDPEHGWTWSNGRPYRYMKWDSGHPLPNPGHNCAVADPAVRYSWQSSLCSKKLGYMCYSNVAEEPPTQAAETGFCSSPWIPYNGHCFSLNRTQKTWSDAQRECRNGGGDLVSIHNVEDQSFVISQLGYTSTDELWIGLNDRKTEGLFDWIDHSTVSFTSWEFGKPAVSTDIQDCILIKGEKGNWADRVCEEKHGYICMKMSASNPTGDEVRQDVGCKTGWRRHGSYCYFIGTQNKMFDDAKGDCQSSNSYLADVSNGVDNAFLVSLVGLRPEKHFWLGLSNQEKIDEFVWTSTGSVTFTYWNAEMPGHRQGCVAMKTGIFAGLWDVLPCTNKEKYICKHLAEGARLTPAPPTPPSTDCPNQWERIHSTNYCYRLFHSLNVPVTWYEARDYCRAIGGDLLSIHSGAEIPHMPYSGGFWIGLSAPDPATGFVWSDGSPLQFQQWADGQPNNKNNMQSCVEMIRPRHSSRWYWNDVHCEKNNGWLCKIHRGVTPKPSPKPATPDYNRTSDGWLEWRGNQYFFNRNSMDMQQARRYCQRRHGDLVTIKSEAESLFLWKQMSRFDHRYMRYWIGLTVDLDRTYGWMDGSPVAFQRWDENQPRLLNNDENCAVMTSTAGFWHDYNCGVDHLSICKRSGSPLANATVAPTVSPRGGCPQNWKKFDSKCYKVIYNQRETWDGARTQCQEMGGNLASIPSRNVQVFLTTTMAEAPPTDLWIGLVSVNGNPYYWTDGQRLTFSNWDLRRIYHGHEYDRRRLYSFSEMDEVELFMREKKCGMLTINTTDIGTWRRTSCNDTSGFICLRNVDPSLPDSPEPTTSNYVKFLNDSFKVVTQKMTWSAAKRHCDADGAKLASLRNKWSQLYAQLITLNLKAPVWIGMNQQETGGFFRFVDGWRLTTTNWAHDEPSGMGSCVYVEDYGRWRTADCDRQMNSICMKSTEVPPTEPSNFPGFCPDNPETFNRRQAYSWLPFRGYCYLFITERAEWPHASANCARHGATLASIEDPSEQDFIKSNIMTYQDSINTFWMGLYKTHRGMWRWLDKTTLDYTNWSEDSYGGSTYAGIKTQDGKWTTANQWQNKAYICKTPKVLGIVPPTTAVTPAMHPQTAGNTPLIVGLVITVIALVAVILLLVFKKSGRRFPIPKRSSAIDNPLFFNNEQSQPHLIDTN